MNKEYNMLLESKEINVVNYNTVDEIVFLEEDVYLIDNTALLFRKNIKGTNGVLYRLMGVANDHRIQYGKTNMFKIIGLFKIDQSIILGGEKVIPLVCQKVYDIFPLEPLEEISCKNA